MKKSATTMTVICCLLAGCFGCSYFGEQAPLEDGLYLSYDVAGSIIRVTFSQADSGKFYAMLDIGDGEGGFYDHPENDNRVLVDKKLKTERGTPYDAGMLGPIWIPPSSVKKGGNAHGDTVSEVRQYNGWDVGVVKANFGRGALRGEWYYEKNTGFLVGGLKASVMDATDGGTGFTLEDTNLALLD